MRLASSTTETRCLDLLSAEREVINFDHRSTSFATGSAPVTMNELVQGSLAFIGSLGQTDIDVLGWSMGGIVALAAPELVHRLVVAGRFRRRCPRPARPAGACRPDHRQAEPEMHTTGTCSLAAPAMPLSAPTPCVTTTAPRPHSLA
ncbi:hypothetical protein JCM4814A_00280 [Streptomyces phaeofaciens JCM 4814]|nr:alpha/beta hydrolase [Streptomyces phaeofaciens]